MDKLSAFYPLKFLTTINFLILLNYLLYKGNVRKFFYSDFRGVIKSGEGWEHVIIGRL